jgi:hypothetical protein
MIGEISLRGLKLARNSDAGRRQFLEPLPAVCRVRLRTLRGLSNKMRCLINHDLPLPSCVDYVLNCTDE